MKNIFFILILSILANSCGEEQGGYYFDFDQIDHYSIEIDGGELIENYDEPDLTTEDSLLQIYVLDDTPTSISDTLTIADLETIGFRKNTLKAGILQEINEIFKEKQHKESSATLCIAVYRDLLVFRKKGKIVGLAKICFGCLEHQIRGTKANTFHFGQSGDYAKLESILNRK